MRKVANSTGESMAEVLVASLVIALALILLVSMVTASFKMVTKSDKSFKNYYTARNELETETETAVGSVTIENFLETGVPTPKITVSLTGAETTGNSRQVKVFVAEGDGQESDGRIYQFIRYEK